MNRTQEGTDDRGEASASAPEDCIHVILYDADGADRDLGLDSLDASGLQDQQLLWIDVACNDAALLDEIARKLGLPAAAIAALQRLDSTPRLENHGECFVLQAVAVEHQGALRFTGTVLGIAAGPNFVLSVHHRPIAFIEQLRERERGDSELGALGAESFTASLLDWQLSTYFEAVSDFEAAVERLEVEILSHKPRECLEDLRELRRGASRLRRMLAPHRVLFAGLARPDFRPRSSGEVDAHFRRLDTHYERAMDRVENTRELMVGSFELFSSQTALRTNAAMRVLTFATVLIGILAVLAGVLGMNFDAAFFDAGEAGFWWTLGGMAAVVVVAVVLARWRRWL
ncbi:magnesium transporter CorA family protein [Lysobacter koreensis]|uniref:Magnesium transporter CorA family protein n=1 Tax=Lysobacter koreensis TaxID=266122 RepID=A0ABW2YJB6_9GAMM